MSTHLLINPSHRSIDKALVSRIDDLLASMTENEIYRYLSETVYLERQRFHGSPDQVSEQERSDVENLARSLVCLLYTSPSPRDQRGSRMPSSA